MDDNERLPPFQSSMKGKKSRDGSWDSQVINLRDGPWYVKRAMARDPCHAVLVEKVHEHLALGNDWQSLRKLLNPGKNGRVVGHIVIYEHNKTYI